MCRCTQKYRQFGRSQTSQTPRYMQEIDTSRLQLISSLQASHWHKYHAGQRQVHIEIYTVHLQHHPIKRACTLNIYIYLFILFLPYWCFELDDTSGIQASKLQFFFYGQDRCLNINWRICPLEWGFICKISLNTKSRIVSWNLARVLPWRAQCVYRCVYSAPVFYIQTTRFRDTLYKANFTEMLNFFTEKTPSITV